MRKEIKDQIERLVRENADANVTSVRIFINVEETSLNETTFKKVEGKSMQNLRGEWIREK